VQVGSAVNKLSLLSINYKRQFTPANKYAQQFYSHQVPEKTERIRHLYKYIGWILILVSSLTLVCLPRFNRNDFLLQKYVGSESIDAEQYILLTQYFQGQDVEAKLDAPFTYRPLVPFIASLLPLNAKTAINIINLFSLIIAVIFLFKLLQILGINFRLNIIGCCLFIFSFPVFYYGTIQYLDPVLVSFVMAGSYCIFRNNLLALTLIIIF